MRASGRKDEHQVSPWGGFTYPIFSGYFLSLSATTSTDDVKASS